MEDTTPNPVPETMVASVPSVAPAAPVVTVPSAPIKKNSSWGVIIAILIILAMMVVGAFYAWGKRISQQPGYSATTHLLTSPAIRA